MVSMAAAEASLGADLLSVVAQLNRLATRRVRLPLPGAQARLLSTIEALGEARICDLAAVDHCSQPTMTTQVRRLEEAGLATRTTDPGDARAVLVKITSKGLQTLSRVRRDRAAAIDPQLARLSADDRRALRDAVTVLRQFLHAETPAILGSAAGAAHARPLSPAGEKQKLGNLPGREVVVADQHH